MRPGPKKPGESAAEYNARVKAMEQKWMSGMGRPKSGGTKGGAAAAAAAPGPKTPAQLAREAKQAERLAVSKASRARLERLRGTTMSKPAAPTAASRKAESERLMRIRGSDMPKGKPAPKPVASPTFMKKGGMVKGKK